MSTQTTRSPTRALTLIRFCLRMTAPGGVTVPGTDRRDEVDAVLDTDHLGRPHLPATSIAGCLRQEVADRLGPDRADALFGHLTERGANGADVDAVASALWFLGSRLVDDNGRELTGLESGSVLQRVSTAVDRSRAAARIHTLRAEELLPAGTRFEVFLRWPDAEPADRDDLLALIRGWRPLIGRGVSRGRGSCRVEDLSWGALDLADPSDLLTWVTTGGPALFTQVANRQTGSGDLDSDAREGPGADDEVLLRISARLDGPLLIGNGQTEKVARSDHETTEVTLSLFENGEYVIPGSGLKGVLRARCEYLLRSVAGGTAACLDQKCANCLPCQIFGHGGGEHEKSGVVGRRARIRIRDASIAGAVTRERTHVAIDRFTGGAAPGLLFTQRVVEAGTFHLVIDDLRLPESLRAVFGAVLRLALGDLDDGLIGLGQGTTRGYGSVRLDLDAAEAGGYLPTLTVARGILSELSSDSTAREDQ